MNRGLMFALALDGVRSGLARSLLSATIREECPLDPWFLNGRVTLEASGPWEYGYNSDLQFAMEALTGEQGITVVPIHRLNDLPSRAAKGIAALLLFGEWSREPWPLIQACVKLGGPVNAYRLGES